MFSLFFACFNILHVKTEQETSVVDVLRANFDQQTRAFVTGSIGVLST